MRRVSPKLDKHTSLLPYIALSCSFWILQIFPDLYLKVEKRKFSLKLFKWKKGIIFSLCLFWELNLKEAKREGMKARLGRRGGGEKIVREEGGWKGRWRRGWGKGWKREVGEREMVKRQYRLNKAKVLSFCRIFFHLSDKINVYHFNEWKVVYWNTRKCIF